MFTGGNQESGAFSVFCFFWQANGTSRLNNFKFGVLEVVFSPQPKLISIYTRTRNEKLIKRWRVLCDKSNFKILYAEQRKYVNNKKGAATCFFSLFSMLAGNSRISSKVKVMI